MDFLVVSCIISLIRLLNYYADMIEFYLTFRKIYTSRKTRFNFIYFIKGYSARISCCPVISDQENKPTSKYIEYQKSYQCKSQLTHCKAALLTRHSLCFLLIVIKANQKRFPCLKCWFLLYRIKVFTTSELWGSWHKNVHQILNNLVLIIPPVRCKVSHFIYNCFCYGQGMRLNTSYKTSYHTAVAARA